MDPYADAKVNLSKAGVLVLESNQHAADMLAQMLKGFGVAEVFRCTSIDEANKAIKGRTVDLIIADPKVRDGDGFQFLFDLRHSGVEPGCHLPIILTSGHSTPSDVKRSRDTGANFFVAKPLSAKVLLERILWVARDKRAFLEVGQFVGPDRRVKFEGPPPGCEGRRASDMMAPLTDADGPNMSQNEIDSLLRPQKVML